MQNDPMLEDDDFPPLSSAAQQTKSTTPKPPRHSNRLKGTTPKSSKPPPIASPLSKFWGSKQPVTLTPIGTTRPKDGSPSLLSGKQVPSSSRSTPFGSQTPLSDVHMELIDPSKGKTTTTSLLGTTSTESTNSTSLSTLSTPSTLRPASALKQRKSPSISATKDPPPPIHPSLDSYKFKTVVEISVKITKTDQVYPKLRENMLRGLKFIQQFGDSTAAIIPRAGST